MNPILKLAEEKRIKVIEDAAQAHGATYNDIKVGALGLGGIFSFQTSKNMSSGEGGAIVTNDDDFADACIFSVDKSSDSGELYNVGSGENVSIKDLCGKISSLVNYSGNIKWNTDMPNGTPNRPLDSTKFYSLGWKPSYTLDKGLSDTYEWYLQNRFPGDQTK